MVIRTILGLLAYTAAWGLSCLLVWRFYRQPAFLEEGSNGHTKKMPLFCAFVIAGIFTLYNLFITLSSVNMAGDRRNYQMAFLWRGSSSIGLNGIMAFVRWIGGDITALFCVSTFLTVLVTMLAYRHSKAAGPESFLLLCGSQYFLDGMVAFKQVYSSAFAALFFVLILEKGNKRARFVALLCAVLACLFHPTGFILFPLYFLFREKRVKHPYLYMLILLVAAVCFRPLMVFASRIMMPVFPSLGQKIEQYFHEGFTISGGIHFIKGLPYYFITAFALWKRKQWKDCVEHYDQYLFLCIMGSFLWLISIFNVWMSRFGDLFVFAFCIYFARLCKELKIHSNRVVMKLAVGGSMFFLTYRFLLQVYVNYGGF